jgi:undecaprenyl pyrophosphate phosphatase UppP
MDSAVTTQISSSGKLCLLVCFLPFDSVGSVMMIVVDDIDAIEQAIAIGYSDELSEFNRQISNIRYAHDEYEQSYNISRKLAINVN